MENLWTYREEVAVGDRDIVGFDVEALDGSIGKIDGATRETDTDHIVVDTGFWIFGKKRLIPAGVVTAVDIEGETVHVSLTKDQIKDAPDWDERWTDDDNSRESYATYYGPFTW